MQDTLDHLYLEILEIKSLVSFISEHFEQRDPSNQNIDHYLLQRKFYDYQNLCYMVLSKLTELEKLLTNVTREDVREQS